MLRLGRPDDAAIEAHLDDERALPFTYADAGTSRDGGAPPRFNVDHTRRRLGEGEAAFAVARDAIRAWQMFPAWTRVHPRAAIAEGEVVGVVIRVVAWWVNPCRIVYVVDEPRRFGFAYGTLPGHAERGEERFLVEWDADDGVWYDVRAFSRPRHPLAWLGYPFTRALQHRFARHSADAMAAWVRARRVGD